ncbi:MAG TPA: carbonic anhydrase [Gemmataceae bacterium]|jgi:carbonic anhydrase|nr:carbonic anhydrase [Gemmataceae bacterium]
MQKLLQGVHRFESGISGSQRELFQRLAGGQSPDALFITCSDSRINPNLITQTDPGELFIIRNAGNIVPPYGAANGGEGATLEFAIVGLGIRDIIVCGHSRCGAINGLMNPGALEKLPAMASWLKHAEATRWIARQKYSDLPPDALLNVATQENVLVQMENLRTHPAVAAGLANGGLALHGWVYKIETGQVFAYNTDSGQFLPVVEGPTGPVPPQARLTAAQSI